MFRVISSENKLMVYPKKKKNSSRPRALFKSSLNYRINRLDEDLIFMASNFSKNKREPQANRLTFHVHSDSAECKINEITGKTVTYSFSSITRNYTSAIFA